MVKNNERLGYLDSIRGIAAFVVVLSHCWLLNSDAFQVAHHNLSTAFGSPADFLYYGLAKVHAAGRAAVIVFFVLSGFVLTYSLQRKSLPYLGYIVRRFFRIYPAFVVTILGSYALHNFIGFHHAVSSTWLEKECSPDLSLAVLMKHFILWGTTGSTSLDGVTWTLVHEMRISLFFPLVLFLVGRYGSKSLFAFWLFSLAAALWVLHETGSVDMGTGDGFILSLLDTVYFIVFFALGAYLAVDRQRISHRVAILPVWVKTLLFALVVGCFFKGSYDGHAWMNAFNDYIRGVGAVGLLVLALGLKNFSHALSHGIFVWLGRISYSLYLVHLPILYTVVQTVGEFWSVFHISFVVIVLSLVIAEMMARAIEFPMIERGKVMCEKWRK